MSVGLNKINYKCKLRKLIDKQWTHFNRKTAEEKPQFKIAKCEELNTPINIYIFLYKQIYILYV